MTKCKWLFCIVGILLFLAACGRETAERQAEAIEMEVEGQSAVVRFDQGTLSSGTIEAGENEYAFAYDMSGALTIRYPNGSVFTLVNGGAAASLEYDGEEFRSKGYLDGLSLVWGLESALEQARGTSGKNSPSPLLAMVLSSLGLWNLLAPRSVWYLSSGWRYKNVEPSDGAIIVYRLGGVALLFFGVMCLLAAL